MITEDYVSFETAKLLKEKGFDEKCVDAYISQKARFEAEDDDCYYNPPYTNHEFDDWYEKDCCTKPTLQMAMKWLREVHNRHISIEHSYVLNRYKFYITKYNPNNISDLNNTLYSADYYFSTYEEACEAAIKYCLENLI